MNRILFLTSIIFLSLQAPSYAQSSKAPQFSKRVGKEANKALEALNNNEPKHALIILDQTLQQQPNLKPYEKSTIYKMRGQANYDLSQSLKTIQDFETAIDAGGLNEEEEFELRELIAKLWISNGKYQHGAELLELLVGGVNSHQVDNDQISLLVNAWIQAENYEQALPWAKRWYNDAEPKERKHYDLMNFLYNHLRQTEQQIEIIERMRQRWPNDKTLWDNLASIHANNGNERKAFDLTLESYETGNPHNERDILRLVDYLSHYEMPYKAAYTLEQEIEAGRVSKTLRNLVWLSILYEEAGYEKHAKLIFSEAVAMHDKIAVEKMRKTLLKSQVPTRISIPNRTFPQQIPVFVPPKTNPREFKIVVSDRDAQPLVRIPPELPQNAKKSGSCKMRFDVDNMGRPYNIISTFCSEAIFEDAAIQSVEKWIYSPKIVDGQAVSRSKVEYRVRFHVHDKDGMIIPE